MFELEIGLIVGGELNFDQCFLHLNVKKNICKELLTVNIEYETLLAETANLLGATKMPTFIFTLAFLNEKNKISWGLKKSTLWGIRI